VVFRLGVRRAMPCALTCFYNIPSYHAVYICSHLTQTSGLLTPCATKLQPRSIRHLNHLPSQKSPLCTQQCLRNSFSPRSKPSQINFQIPDLPIDPRLLHPTHDIRSQLKSRIIMFPPRVPKPDIPRREAQNRSIRRRHLAPLVRIDISRRSSNSDMDIMSRSVDM
jgi:hypothetical protein